VCEQGALPRRGALRPLEANVQEPVGRLDVSLQRAAQTMPLAT